MAVAITRSDISAAKLRKAAARTQDAKAARRMLAIALVLEDWSREAAAQACAMDRQTLRDWVHRYNELGLDGTGRDGDRISGFMRGTIAGDAGIPIMSITPIITGING